MQEMQLAEILAGVPTWAWVLGGFILFALVFGDRGLWDYEVEFPPVEGKGKGEIDFKCYKKRGTLIEVELSLDPAYQNRSIEIYLKGSRVYSIPKEKNNKKRIYLTDSIRLSRPSAGDEVSVNSGNEVLFTGKLVVD